MTIQDLIDQFTIQGGYIIKMWNDEAEDSVTLAEGSDFEYEHYKIKSKYLNKRITYMYAVDGVLNIEVE